MIVFVFQTTGTTNIFELHAYRKIRNKAVILNIHTARWVSIQKIL